MKINDIRCEYLINPIGIDIKNPRITWNLSEGNKQTGYKIIYQINGKHKESEFIKTSSMNYVFKDEFNSRDIVTYQIEVFDENGKSFISEENSFEFGLLNKSDFIAKWISGNYKVNKKRRYPADYFLKTFNVKDVKKARLYITALGLYEAKINGKRVGDFVLAPGSTDYNKRVQYQTYDCLNLLKEGENTLEVVLGDGWFRSTNGSWGHPNTFGTQTKLYLQLELTDSHDQKTIIISDESFKWSNDGPIGINDLKDGERVDANRVQSYKNLAKVSSFDANFRSSNNYYVKEKEFIKPIREIITPSGKHVLEFPFNMAGYISFKLNAKKGQTIRIVLGELIDKNGEFTLSNIQCRSKRTVTPLQEIDYVFKEGLNEYTPKFFFGGFRYALIETDVEYTLDNFTGIAIYNDFHRTSEFSSSNKLLDIFFENTLRSLKSNSIDVPTDCPTRERAGWTGDSQIFLDTATYLVDYAPFARKHINDLIDRQFKDGRYAQIVPTVNEDFYMATLNGSVGWADAGILIPYRCYLKYGDIRFIKDNYESMLKYINFMIKRIGKWGGPISKHVKISRKGKKYLVRKGQSYGEWLEPVEIFKQHWTDVIFPHPEVSTAYTNYVLRIFKEISNLTGHLDIIPKLDKYIEGTKKSYQELVSTEKFSLDTDRQANLVRPLYMKLLNEEQEKFAKDRLIKALDNFSWRIGTGFLSTPFILEVLKDMNWKYAYKLLENEEKPGWLFMAKNSTGTIWESREGAYGNDKIAVASLNHYSKGAMSEFLIKEVLGIKVLKENTFEISPVIGGSLTYAKGYYESIYGKISVDWKKENNQIVFKIDVPANVEAKFKFIGTTKELKPGENTIQVNL